MYFFSFKGFVLVKLVKIDCTFRQTNLYSLIQLKNLPTIFNKIFQKNKRLLQDDSERMKTHKGQMINVLMKIVLACILETFQNLFLPYGNLFLGFVGIDSKALSIQKSKRLSTTLCLHGLWKKSNNPIPSEVLSTVK